MEKYQEIERSIITTYRSRLWSKFTKAIKDYKLVNENDKICVCISGGKDSMLLAKLFEELHKHSNMNFEVIYLVMNPGYNKVNLDLIKHNLKYLGQSLTLRVLCKMPSRLSLQERSKLMYGYRIFLMTIDQFFLCWNIGLA